MKRHLPLIAACVIAFILGMVCERGVMRARIGHFWSDDHTAHLVQLFSHRLKLTADQQTKVGAILEASHQKMRALHEQIQPQFEALRSDTHQQIRALLTPAQAQTFDAMEAKFDARRRAFRARHRTP